MSDTPRTDAVLDKGKLEPITSRAFSLADHSRRLERELAKARKALTEISNGEGSYSRNPLMHSANCIEEMKAIAIKALRKEAVEVGRGCKNQQPPGIFSKTQTNKVKRQIAKFIITIEKAHLNAEHSTLFFKC